MWERGSTLRTELSAVDISWYVVARAERAMAGDGCLWAPLFMSAAVALFTPFIRLVQVRIRYQNRLANLSHNDGFKKLFTTPCYIVTADDVMGLE